MTYDDFIKQKIVKTNQLGFEPLKRNTDLFPWQELLVQWAIRQGRAGLFEDCGLGKTIQELEIAEQVAIYTQQPVLILCPLAVAEQTCDEGWKFGYDVTHAIHQKQVTIPGVYITNYDKLDRFTPECFGGVILDESSILKSFDGKTRQTLTNAFQNTRYKFVASATPSPNDYTEFAQQAEFLGIMTRAEMLATFFINDTSKTGTWRLKQHAVKPFWEWVSTWAACVTKPSDIGFTDEGYDLPELKIIKETVPVDTIALTDGMLFRDISSGMSGMRKEMKLSLEDRCKKAAEVVAKYPGEEPICVWVNTNDESDLAHKLIPNSVEVYGHEKEEIKAEKLRGFSSGKIKRIITKPKIGGLGLNWQHCSVAIYIGLSYSWEQLYQSIKRLHRFGQKNTVYVYIIQAETETSIMQVIETKGQKHEEMVNMMKFAADKLKNNTNKIEMNTDIECVEGICDDFADPPVGPRWKMYNGDCVRVCKTLPDASVDFSVFSPPFADLFTYSNDPQDMGNCSSMAEFMEQFRYLVKELGRLIKPGRLCAVHCADLRAIKWKDGTMGVKDFSGTLVNAFCGDVSELMKLLIDGEMKLAIDSFKDSDFLFHARITIRKDPVVEQQRSKALHLLQKQLFKDSSMSGVASPEYVLVFKRKGENEKPIKHNAEEYPLEQWQHDAEQIWSDIDQGDVFNAKVAKEKQDERHLCPLQKGVIRRALRLWSNPGDLVFSPFAGIGSEGLCALEMGRQFIGAELKRSYFETACNWLHQMDNQPELQLK